MYRFEPTAIEIRAKSSFLIPHNHKGTENHADGIISIVNKKIFIKLNCFELVKYKNKESDVG